jgi:predicted transposase YbfD/YdcC
MSAEGKLSILDHFASLPEPRELRTCKHVLGDILVIGLCAVMGGANSWEDIQLFGQSKRDWFKRFLSLPNGIPSHDTFNRVFQALAPQAFQECFVSWMNAVCEACGLKHAQIDGKAARGSHKRGKGLGCLHTVSVWASQNGLTFGQVATEEKSNEITAIPKLLQMLELKGAIVTIDAAGTQKEIVKEIRSQQADYLLPVKENQPTLYRDVVAAFHRAIETDFEGIDTATFQTTDKGHGRLETRTYTVIYNPVGLSTAEDWQDLKAILMVCRERRQGEARSDEVTYYISSSTANIDKLAAAIRDHWGIENGVHWVLDVVFGEDQSRARAGNAAENLAWLRRVALALLKQDPSKGSLKGKRLKAGWDNDFLHTLLGRLDTTE